MRRLAAFFLFTLSAVLLGVFVVDMKLLATSALSYRWHHEVAAPLCIVLIWPILSLAALVRGAHVLGRANVLAADAAGADALLVALVPVLVGCSLLFENEVFFASFDPKGYPAHPMEVIAHPHGHWVTPTAHTFAALILLISMSALVWALKERE